MSSTSDYTPLPDSILGESLSTRGYGSKNTDPSTRLHFVALEGFGTGTTVLVIPVVDGFYFVVDGRWTRAKSIFRSDAEKYMEITSKIFIVHGGIASNNILVKQALARMGKERDITAYALAAQDVYRAQKDFKDSCCFIFGFDKSGSHQVYFACGKQSGQMKSKPYYLLGGGTNCAKPFLESIFVNSLTNTLLSKADARLVSEVLLAHVSLLSSCTGGRIVHIHVPFVGPNHTIITSDIELYAKHFDYFEDINRRAFFLIIERTPENDSRYIQRLLGCFYFDLKFGEEAQNQLSSVLFVDELYTESNSNPFKLFMIRCQHIAMVRRVLEDEKYLSDGDDIPIIGVRTMERRVQRYGIGPCRKRILQQFMNL